VSEILKKVFVVLVSCVAVTAFAAGMSERAFTDTFLQQAKSAFPDVEITVVRAASAQDESQGRD
jgi:ABC-type molybdate transport system substrate-binding protein